MGCFVIGGFCDGIFCNWVVQYGARTSTDVLLVYTTFSIDVINIGKTNPKFYADFKFYDVKVQ